MPLDMFGARTITTDHRPIARLLIRLCRGSESAPLVDPAHAEEVRAACEMSRRQGVASLLYQRLHHTPTFAMLPDDIRVSLSMAAREAALLSLRRQRAMADILAAFQARSIPVIVLKGAFLAAHVYRNPSQRQMLDVDLMVRRITSPPPVRPCARWASQPTGRRRLVVTRRSICDR